MSTDRPGVEILRRMAERNRISLPDSEVLTLSEEEHLLRAKLNAVFFAEAEKWMLPEWAIKTIWKGGTRNRSGDLLSNDQYLNWIVLGGPGSSSYAISDSVGLTTTLENRGSIEFWPQSAEIQFPALQENNTVRMNLVSADDQMYEWKIALGPIEFDRLLYHVTEDDKEYIFNEIVLRNVSLEPQEFTFFVAIRPFSIRGVEPIESIVASEDGSRLYVNDSLSLIADRPPVLLIMDTFDNPNLLDLAVGEERINKSYSEARGKGTALMKYTIKLRPAGHENIIFASPLFTVSPRDPKFSTNLSPKLRDDSVAKWFDFNDDAPKGNYPDDDISMAAAQAKTSLVIQARKHVHRMTPLDLISNTSEIARIHLSLSRSRCVDIALTLAEEISQKLSDEKTVMENAAQLAPIFWTLSEMKSIHFDLSFPASVNTFRNRMERAIESLLQSHHDQLLKSKKRESIAEFPKSESFENEPEDPNLVDQYPPPYTAPESVPPVLDDIHSNIWILACAEMLADDKESIRDTIHAYREMVVEQSEDVLSNQRWSLESSDDMNSIFDLIGAFTLLKGNHVYIPLIEELVKVIQDKCLYRGLLRYPKPDHRVSSHLRLRLANALVFLYNRDDVESTLERLPEYLSEYYVLPDWVNIDTKGGFYGNGCSLMAAADLRLLLRDILVYEKEGNLFVFPGIPEPWFTSTKSLMAEGIPTQGGLVNLETGVSANQHQIEIELETLPEEIEVFLPSHIPLHMVKIFGGSIIERAEEPIKRIRLVPLSERITLTFHR